MEFEKFQKEHLESVFALSNEAFGKEYNTKIDLEKYVGTNKHLGFVVLVSDKVVGIINSYYHAIKEK